MIPDRQGVATEFSFLHQTFLHNALSSLGYDYFIESPYRFAQGNHPPVRFAPGGMVYILYMCFILAQGKWQLNVWQLSFLEIV